MMTTYQFIARVKNEHPWIWVGCCTLFERANTLDMYFNIYSRILECEPERTRGYRKRLARNHLITCIIKKRNKDAVCEESNIDWVIKPMETPLLLV